MNSTLAFTAALAAALLVLPAAAYAQDAREPRFASCHAQASKKALKGRQRQEFIGTCMRSGSAAVAPAAQKPAVKGRTPAQQAAERVRNAQKQ
jgi:hypothetical protein